MYKYLSACYDQFMNDVDYDAWAEKLAARIGDRKKESTAVAAADLSPCV